MNESLEMYRGVIAEFYPSDKKRGDGKDCAAVRKQILKDLLLLPVVDLQDELQRMRMCAIAYDACVFEEQGPEKGEISDFLYGVGPMLREVLVRLRPEFAKNILGLLRDLEFMETYHQKPFITHEEALEAVSVYGLGHDEEDDFEQQQIIDETAGARLGLDRREDDE